MQAFVVAGACRPANSPGASNSEPPVIDTVYFGGGTPSLLAPSALAKILATLERTCRFATPEITLEADPETITSEKAKSWRAAGFNRISLGVQSFNDRELQATGRMHRRADVDRAAEILRAAAFDNISMDLIAGLPHQTRESWEHSVAEILRLRPEHISIYMLEIDEGSHLGKESLAGGARYSAAAIPPDDTQAEFYESACANLAAAGYDHYEISNWALPGRRSRHNLKYWQRDAYLGLGAGAHSFDGATRWANAHDSARYVASIEQGASPREQIEPVAPEQALEEEFFLGLRQLDGIDLARIERQYASNGNGTSARIRPHSPANRSALRPGPRQSRKQSSSPRSKSPHYFQFRSGGTARMTMRRSYQRVESALEQPVASFLSRASLIPANDPKES